jgi:DNA-binding beta-propeller fold protein YncE
VRRQAKPSFAGSKVAIGLVLAGLLSLLLAPAAFAEPATPTYAYTGAFGASGSGNGEFNTPAHVAIEPGTGNILVADSGNDRVQVFAPDAGAIGTYLTTIDTGAGSAPFGIAIDQGTGAIYVSLGGDNEIVRYTSDGAPIPTYTEDPAFANPAEGTGPAESPNFVTASALAVDPTNHDLLVADPSTNVVSRYTAAGVFVSSFDGSDSAGGAFTGLLDIAAGANGTTYVVDGSGDLVLFGAPSRIERFDGSGVSQGALELSDERGAPRATPRAVAVDPSSGRVVAVGRSWLFPGEIEPRLYMFSATGTEPIAHVDYPEAAHRGIAIGVAISSDGTHRLYGAAQKFFGAEGADAVYGFDPAVTPGVEIKSASNLTPTSAKLNGTVDPGGSATSAYFEYSADSGVNWVPTDPQDMGEGTGEQDISAAISGLAPNTDYLVRLQASNAFGNAKTSANGSFTTAVAPPAVSTGGAGDITASSATLNGSINPFGLLTTYHFEYGTTDQYGSRTPAGEAPAGNGRVQRSFSQSVSGLQSGVTYHYRLVATSAAGTTNGADRTFTSVGSAEVKRAFEQVTPVDKGGNFIPRNRADMRAAADGNSITYGTTGAFGMDIDSGPVTPRYRSVRGPEGWSPRSLDVEQRSPLALIPNFGRTTLAISDDLSHSVAISDKALVPGGVNGGTNLYLVDNATGALTLIGASPSPVLYARLAQRTSDAANEFIVGGTPDFSVVAFISDVRLTPDGLEGAKSVYLWSQGALSLISKDKDGQSLQVESLNPGSGVHVPDTVSDDGTRIYFSSFEIGSYQGVYLYTGGYAVPISVSHRAGDDPETVIPGHFYGASSNGRYAFFETGTSSGLPGLPLTEDAKEDRGNVYRYDAVTGALELVSAGVEAMLGKSDDGSYAYLLLSPDSEGKPLRVGVWHEGSLREVGSAGESSTYEVSPNGHYAAFTDPVGALMLYDAQTESLSCASCSADEATSAVISEVYKPQVDNHWARLVIDNGTVFFSTAGSLVAGDVNGVEDVYEFRDGQARLVSTGTNAAPSFFTEASADGRDVFFLTEGRLIQQDNDDLADLYDARVGGGIDAQQVAAVRQECSGGSCQAAGPIPPPPAVGSEAVNGPGNSSARKKARCGQGRHRVAAKGKGKSRCMPKQAKKHRKHGNGNRRQGR